MLFNLSRFYQENKNNKLEIFLDFVLKEAKKANFNDFDTSIFEGLDEDFFIRSLDYYVEKRNVTAKITAENYISNLTTFFADLADKHELINPVFRDVGNYSGFKEKANVKISGLNDTISKDTLSQEDYIKLCEEISDFCSDNKIIKIRENVLTQLENYFLGNVKNTSAYKKLLSCTATKLVLLTGLGNDKVVNLRLDDMDVNQSYVKVGDSKLYLDSEFKLLLTEYKKCRSFILSEAKKESEYLFISRDGERVLDSNGNAYNGYIFSFYHKLFDNIRMGELSNRRILDMIRSGIDLCTISEITGTSEETCINLQRGYNESQNYCGKSFKMEGIINPFLFDNPEAPENIVIQEQKETIACPNCRNEVPSSENYWVLLLKSDGVKYLVCQECKGVK